MRVPGVSQYPRADVWQYLHKMMSSLVNCRRSSFFLTASNPPPGCRAKLYTKAEWDRMADSAPAKELYQYQPLQDGSHIRLVEVTGHITTRSEPRIEVQLEEYALRQALPYKALSYTWGASERPEQIIIGQNSRLNVTINLFAFLVYLSKKKPRIFLGR